MLFEAWARYLFVFLPLLIVMSAVGMRQYVEWGMEGLQRRKGMHRLRGMRRLRAVSREAVEPKG